MSMSSVGEPRRIGVVTPEQLRSLSGLEFLRRVVAGELPAPPHAWLRAMPQAQTLPIPLGRAFCLVLTPVSRACLTSRTFSFDFCCIPHVFVRYVGRVDMEVGSCIYKRAISAAASEILPPDGTTCASGEAGEGQRVACNREHWARLDDGSERRA